MSAPPVSFDWSALVQAVSPREARAFAKTMREQGRAPGTTAIGIVVLVIGGIVVASTVFSSAVRYLTAVFEGDIAHLASAFVPFILVGVVVALTVFVVVRGPVAQGSRWLKLDRFSRANGMSFVPSLPAPQLPGMIFNRGSNRESTDLVRGAQPRFVEFANYRFVTGSGKSRTTHRWGYVAVKLDVPLPHIILDAKGNNALFGSNLPRVFDRDQRLNLEGDFDEHFALYCPNGYERDALYLFTPDIMARFIDNAAQLDVEIVDDWLFLYAKRDLSTLDPATWGWLFTVVAALLDKLAQWGRWRDDRLAAVAPPMPDAVASGIPGAQPGPTPLMAPPPGVAQPGRRLRGGVPWAAIIVFGVIGLGWLFATFSGVFGR